MSGLLLQLITARGVWVVLSVNDTKYSSRWYARLGVQNLSVESRPEDIYSFNRIIAHPEYVDGSGNRGSDIGLLKVDREIYYHGKYLVLLLN